MTFWKGQSQGGGNRTSGCQWLGSVGTEQNSRRLLGLDRPFPFSEQQWLAWGQVETLGNL